MTSSPPDKGRPRKLALIVPGFQSDESDWCIPALTNLARELAKNVELHVFALRYPPFRRNYSVGAVHVHAIGGGFFGRLRIKGASLLNLWLQAAQAITREHTISPFYAIAGIWATESGWIATRAARSLSLPSLVHVAGGELVRLPSIRYGNRGGWPDEAIISSALRSASVLTVPSRPVLGALPPWVPASKVRSWSLGVDTQMFSPERPPTTRSDFTLVTAGSLIPVKGHSLLLHAMAEVKRLLPDKRVRLNIAGGGPLRDQLGSLAKRLHVDTEVQFLGDVPHDVLPQLYRSAGAFVLSSLYEAQCMAALEALACGLPWAGPPVGAMADISAGGLPTGIAVPERSPRALAEAITRLAALPEDVMRSWASEARGRVVDDYDLEKQSARLLDLLDETVAASLPSGATPSRG